VMVREQTKGRQVGRGDKRGYDGLHAKRGMRREGNYSEA
jgi:hypothetical protein